MGLLGLSQDALDEKRLDRLIHTSQLVEGTVFDVGEGGGRVYLNFADDWQRDFTVSIARKDVRAIAAAGLDPKSLQGKRLRVRSWLAWRGGPMIETTHPEQIELLTGHGKDVREARQNKSRAACAARLRW